MQRKQLSRKKAREILSLLKLERANVEEIIYPSFSIFLVNKKPLAIKRKDYLVPSLIYALEQGADKYVIVDAGAKEKILKGADVLRPGIVEFSDFKKGDCVFILDEENKVLAVGIALWDSGEAISLKKGKIIKNIHYFGDKIWKEIKNFL